MPTGLPPLRLMAVGGENGGPMVPDYSAQAAGIRRYVGRRLDPTRGAKFESEELVRQQNGNTSIVTVQRRNAVFVPHPEQVVFEYPANGPYAVEYLRHVAHGELLAADEYTAALAAPIVANSGHHPPLVFDPEFAKSLHKMHVEEPDDTEAYAAESKSVLESVMTKIRKPTPSSSGGDK